MSEGDILEARLAAMRALDGILDGSIENAGALRRAWPGAGGSDPLLKRAFHEGTHLLVTRGELERRIVELVRRFLEEGGAPSDYEDAYDELVRDIPPEERP